VVRLGLFVDTWWVSENNNSVIYITSVALWTLLSVYNEMCFQVLRWLRVREMLTRIEILIGSWKVLCLDKHSSLLDPGGVPDEAEPLERGTSLNWMDMNELILGCMSTESTSSVPLLKKWRQELACEALLG
jgi:hypothetical protein